MVVNGHEAGRGPMSPHDVFLDAVRAEPDDDTHRLVYADWLDEHGESARAEFIRIQCQLARMAMTDANRPPLEARESELLASHYKAWAAPLAGLVVNFMFRRGMIERVQLSAKQFFVSAERIFSLAPVQEIKLDGISDEEAIALAASPHLSSLTHLDLWLNGLGDEAVEALAASPYLSRLATLVLCDNDIGNEGAAALASSSTLTSLTSLDLSENEIEDMGALALASSSTLSKLTYLNLYGNRIRLEGAQALMASPTFGTRTFLNLSQNRIGDEEVRALRDQFGARLHSVSFND
jgi:uncharacterized protein (TIGR02996 family)